MKIGHPTIEAFCREHFNEPVLFSFRVCRLIGYAETARDAYYVTRYPLSGEIVWETAVGPCMTLRDLKTQSVVQATNGETWNNYTRLDGWLTLNKAPPAEAFVLDLRPNDDETSHEQ